MLSILVAEDLADSVELMRLAFRRTGLKASLNFARDGKETIQYLKGEGVFADRTKYPPPTVLLLDLKMPGIDGFGVLEWIRGEPGLRRLPVVVFTTSQDRTDINRAYEMGASSYLVKPQRFDELEEMVSHLETYWLGLNQSPDYLVER